MRTYELLLILNPTLNDEDRATTLERIGNLVRENGSEPDTVEEWGKRKLAYEINKLNDGDYVLYEFKAEPANVAEIDRVLGITDAVVRFIIVRRDDK
ncbi:MAG: 30S ribosomal protein S6 [Coriobacteriia bacterium]|nr:30S ribosomal protein S6 [Coriobacteriia bacterium]